MSIRTTEHLNDSLSSALAWRKKELAALKSLIDRRSLKSSKKNVLLRSGVAILYAHWEGFIKEASRAYLEYVAYRRLPYAELSRNFIALRIRALLEKATGSGKMELHREIVRFILDETGKRSQIPYKTAIPAKGNLSSDRFRNIVSMLGLDYSQFETKEKLVDQRLLEKRNSVAHGQYLLIDKSDYEELHLQVFELLNLFRNNIENAAVRREYLAA